MVLGVLIAIGGAVVIGSMIYNQNPLDTRRGGRRLIPYVVMIAVVTALAAAAVIANSSGTANGVPGYNIPTSGVKP